MYSKKQHMTNNVTLHSIQESLLNCYFALTTTADLLQGSGQDSAAQRVHELADIIDIIWLDMSSTTPRGSHG